MLSKTLKKKRDAEDRLRQTSPPVQFVSALDGEGAEVQSYKSPADIVTTAQLNAGLALKSNINHTHAEYALAQHTHDIFLDANAEDGEAILVLDCNG